jgi:xanthine/CO dehydrogenase XdhC/CoxF family maturation factor
MAERHQHSGADPACAMAHGDLAPEVDTRTLVVVFASPVARYLLHFAADVGFRTVLVEPVPAGPAAPPAGSTGPSAGSTAPPAGSTAPPAVRVETALSASFVDGSTDVVVADHDRPELGAVLRDALALPARWIGVMGSVRHPAPHLDALRALGVAEDDIARVHRPIGLNIGSHSPAEIAVATLAGLIADRNGRPGGFAW